jgi:hypothetical protein
MRLNITLRPPQDEGDRTVGFTAEGLASIADGTVVSTVQRYDSEGNDLAIIEWPGTSLDDDAYIRQQLDADDRVLSYH